MEAAGFALGVASAVGLLGQIFDGCVKAYAFFTKAKNLGRDSERLVCKIRIEEMRLMVWGREWGVVEGRLEDHLAARHGGNEGLKQLAEMILKQLYETITDFNKLQDRYGLREDISNSDIKTVRKSPDPTDNMTIRLRDELKLRARWVIGDKDKFELLLKDLKDFNDGLERLFPPGRIATLQRTWTNELLQGAQRDMGQLDLLEAASNGVYPNLNAFAKLKQLRINLDAKEPPKKMMSSSELRILKSNLMYSKEGDGKRIKGQYESINCAHPSLSEVVIEWMSYDPELDLDSRLILYQRIDNLARMVHSSSNRHPDLHTLDCIGYFDDTSKQRYGLVYRFPESSKSLGVRGDFQTLTSLIENPNVRTPDLNKRFQLAQTLAIALWSFHSLDWLHKTFCSTNILFFHSNLEPEAYGLKSDDPNPIANNLTKPYVTGFDNSRPDHLDEMTVASKNDIGQDIYRHPDSLGMWRQSYRKSFDIYSLGLVLLEIGLWKSLKGFHKPRYTSSTFRDKVVLGVLVPGLAAKTGSVYREVVERCLAYEEGKESERAGSSQMMERVVLTLESLRV
ncbi:MAG: hypothetical protein M1827_006536 [Pycnora praestabilis]|nr:MAG: hypothetical protein M1827_006536 [Pycnora praestabilis]